MNEFLSIIKLKDKITIISLMVVFAALLATTIGLVTQGTVDPHEHTYAYQLEKVGEGKFAVVGVCTDKSCQDPRASWAVDSLSETIVTEPTCCQGGNTRYVLTTNVLEGEVKSYILDEPIAKLPHKYVGSMNVSENGATIEAVCTNKGCTSSQIKIENIADSGLKLEESKDATCNSDGYQKYSYTVDGITSTIEVGIKGAHTYEIDMNKTVLPTLSTSGSAYIECASCGDSATIVLPKIVVGSNADVISQDADKETQTVKYKYFIDTKKYDFVAEIVIPWDNHAYEYTQSDVVYPTLDSDGSITLKCKNSVCSKEVVVTLPAMKIGTNTTVSGNHNAEKQTYTYTFTNTEYGIDLTYSYELDWNGHTYVYQPDETVNPTLNSDGKAYVRCSYKGCDKYHEITLPKVVIGENTTPVSSATEQDRELHKYTYNNDEYGFTITFNIPVGETLSHGYTYYIEPVGAGRFDFVGKCNQAGCTNPEVRKENVKVELEEHIPSCTDKGYIVARYVDEDGQIYETTMQMPGVNPTGHKYVEVNKVNPSFSEDGTVTLACSNEGCDAESISLILPKCDYNSNIQIVPDALNPSVNVARYIYLNEDYDYVLIIDFPVSSHTTHNYQYEIQFNEKTGGYDLVGQCDGEECEEPIVRDEENIDAIVDEHITDCTVGGYISVKYEKNGVIYSLTRLVEANGKHSFGDDILESRVNPTVENEGSATFKCINEGCDHTVTIVLPKIEIGVNASHPDENSIFYRYTDKETGCEIFIIFNRI